MFVVPLARLPSRILCHRYRSSESTVLVSPPMASEIAMRAKSKLLIGVADGVRRIVFGLQ